MVTLRFSLASFSDLISFLDNSHREAVSLVIYSLCNISGLQGSDNLGELSQDPGRGLCLDLDLDLDRDPCQDRGQGPVQGAVAG